MADKQRAAQDGPLNTNQGVSGVDDGSGISEAASAWEAALIGESGEERTDELDEGKPPQTAGQEGQDDESDEEEESEELEDEGEESEEDEDPDEEEDEEPDDDGQELDPHTKVKVKVDGQELQVTLDELRQGYSRTQDYTQKTQQVAEEKRRVEQEKQEVFEQKQQWSNVLSQMGQRLQAGLSGRTDAEWQELKQKDEFTYYAERENERVIEKRLDAIKQEQQRVQQEHQEHQQEQLKQMAQREGQELMNKVPEWKDPQAFAKDKAKILAYGQAHGYSAEELSGLVDHRAILVLRDAARYQELVKGRQKTPAKGKTRAKTLKPGAPSNESPRSTKSKKAKQRLSKEQSVDAAAGWFETLLDQ